MAGGEIGFSGVGLERCGTGPSGWCASEYGEPVGDGEGSGSGGCGGVPAAGGGGASSGGAGWSQGVYVMVTDAGFVKVGVARDAEARLRTLQTGIPFTLRVARYIDSEADGIPAHALEWRMHAELAHLRTRGEWFEATLADVGRAERLAWAFLTCPALYARWARRFRPGASEMAESSTYLRYRDPEARRAYMREYMKRRRMLAPAKKGGGDE
jgi:hypothetical protein